MAEAEQQAETAAPTKKKSKMILFIIIGVVVVVLAGGAAALLLGKKKPVDEDGEDGGDPKTSHSAKKDAHSDAPPAYVKLDPFTTNLAMDPGPDGQGAGQYIQVTVELKVEDAHLGETLKSYMPEIRNGILRSLSSKKSSELISSEGKDTLAEEIRFKVNRVLNPSESPKKGGKEAAPEGPVQAVLFSSFIIQ